MNAKGSINYAYFVEDVSRKFTLRKNTCSLKSMGVADIQPARYMGGAVRNAKRFDVVSTTPVKKNYMFLRFNPRTSAVTADELAGRLAFKTASKLKKAWNKNLTEVQNIHAAWTDNTNGTAAGVSKHGYTLGGWVFAVAYAVVAGGGTASSPFPAYTPAA